MQSQVKLKTDRRDKTGGFVCQEDTISKSIKSKLRARARASLVLFDDFGPSEYI